MPDQKIFTIKMFLVKINPVISIRYGFNTVFFIE